MNVQSLRGVRAPAILALALALLWPGSLWSTVPATALAQTSGSRTFPETGYTVRDQFLDYWNSHGGLAQQGYPISTVMEELSPEDGKTYSVQYFERAVFELHPENKAPYDVLLSQLGSFYYETRYQSGAPGQRVSTAPGAQRFPQTGYTVGGKFLDYWNSHGGLAQQGYPISDEFQEKSPLDGKTYSVQYFERAAFELHPENKAPYDVLLSQLGTFQYRKLYKTNHLDTFKLVWKLLNNEYIHTDFGGVDWARVHVDYADKVRSAPDEQSAYAVMADMVDALNDGNTYFETPQQARREDAQATSTFTGIGISVSWIKGAARVLYVQAGGPAHKAGLRPTDTIKAIEGNSVHSILDTQLLRGPKGSSVTVTAQLPGQQARDLKIVRDTVTMSPPFELQRVAGTNVVYLNMTVDYTSDPAVMIKDALEQLAGTGPLDGLVLDVRQGVFLGFNGDQDFLKLLVDGGVAGYHNTRQGKIATKIAMEIPSDETVAALRGKPVVMLTGDLCTSDCEIVAMALRDLHRAKLLGTTTAGEPYAQYTHDLPDGSRLSMTNGVFTRADGSSIEGTGLAPDVLLDVPWYQYTLDNDPQVKATTNLILGK